MYVKNINEGKLSAPDLQGMWSDHENNKYIKINNNFINIKKENSRYYAMDESLNKVYIRFSDEKFYPEKHNMEAGFKVDRRKINDNCPGWEIQYNELQNIARDNTVVTVRHRGDSDTNIAENSLSAFRLSYKLCRAAIETDVLLTKDNKPVIFHDVRIGKMMEPSYDPDENTGQNAFLKDMSLAELKTKKLLDPRRRVTDDTIITVDEMLDDYLKQGGQSLIYLEVKEPRVILKVAKIITDKASSDPTLLNRVIVKFNMAEFPTYIDWVAGLRNVDASVNIMANPVMSPAAAERINKLPAGDIPIPEGDPLHDNASRAVYWWSSTPGISVPNVEVVLKSTDSGFINKVRRPSPQGYYEQPISLDMANTIPGTPAYMIAIVKKNGKSLGTYVPVADRIMWRDGFVAGVTVPDTKNPKKRNDITESYYNNDSSCCYTLEDRLAENEKEDVRENVAWNRGIRANIITSDDIDSIDTYAADMNYLDKKALPVTHYPKKEMQSTLAWGMNYWPKPDGAKVALEGWGGASSDFVWGGQVCLWDNKFTGYPWVYQCDAAFPWDYRKDLLMTVVTSDKYGAVNQIFSHDKKYCLSGKDGDYSYMKYIEDCRAENTETHFWYTPLRHLRNLYKGEDVSYVQFYRAGVYYGQAYGLLQNTKTPDSWSEWKMKQVG
ncbi:glycerophosphodiester phosphodiesterase family protein [Erwinia mallotivora]|uniref:glycerophosphodiester phosphodiesterase family protein n=2 Tax=Erwinia mallotivora TaxID=69222 RepID=UPI0027E0BF04|nr:glycerophosphodiester phosphodiesterase family protein [Erwinia mallotivora]